MAVSMDANWVASGAESWRDSGIGGFLFHVPGVSFARSVWSLDGEAAPEGEGDGTLAVFRQTQARLAAAGIGRNFLLIPFTPEGTYFSSGSPADTATARISDAAAFCRLSGLRGVALDTQPTSLFYDFRWDGYGYENYTPEDLVSGAARLGRRAGRALLRELPDAEVLILADGAVSWGPLWISLVGGLLEAVGPAPGASIHILVKSGVAAASDAVRVAGSLETARAFLLAQLGSEAGAIWRKRGQFASGFDPFQATSRGVYAEQLTAALTSSGRYCWLDGRGWQPGAAPGLPSELAAVPARGRLATFQRVGALLEGDVPSFVFLSDVGASVLFPRGLAEALALDSERDKVRVLNLSTDELRGLDVVDGRVTVGPSRGAVLVEGLPVRRWALPAALWARSDMPAEAGADGGGSTFALEYGFAARQGRAVSGTLDVEMPAGYSIVPSSVALSLTPGEALVADAVVRGSFTAGGVLALQLGLVLPGTAPVMRTFSFAVSPAQRWQYSLDGALSGPPAVADVGGEAGTVLFATTVTGQLVSLNSSGGLRWTRRFDGAFVGSPALGRAAFGQWFVVAADARGRIRALDLRGYPIWEERLDGQALLPGPVCVPLDDTPGDDVCVGMSGGTTAAFSATGTLLWKEPAQSEGPGYLSVLPLGGLAAESIVAVRGGRVPWAVCHGRNGKIRWQKRLGSAPVDVPFLYELGGSTLPEILTPLSNGTVAGWDAVSGDGAGRRAIEVTGAMRGFCVVDPGGELGFAAAGADSVVGLNSAMELVWQQPGEARWLSAVADTGGARLLVGRADGTVACLDAGGKTVWVDHHGIGAVAAAPVGFRLAGDAGETVVVVGDTGRFVRGLAFR